MSKMSVPPVPHLPRQSPPPVSQSVSGDARDLGEARSTLERAVMTLGTSFAVSFLVHVAVLAMLAFWVLRQPGFEILITDAGLSETPSAADIETLKLQIAPASVPKDDVSPLQSNVALEAASSGSPSTTIDVSLPDAPGLGVAGGGTGEGIFGTGSGAKSFVFVVDCSSSMSGGRFQRAIGELLGVIGRLRPDQRFFVVFYNHVSIPMFSEPVVMNFPFQVRAKKQPTRRKRRRRTGRFGNALVRGVNTRKPGRKGNVKRMLRGTPANKRKAKQWILRMRPTGGTKPREALQLALGLKSQVVYFLTDGEIPPDTPDVIRDGNRAKSVVHTVALGFEGSAELLKRIAAQNGGRYTFAR